jgi:protein-L-isoaspartate(D-aspartate) O-methyltransferase
MVETQIVAAASATRGCSRRYGSARHLFVDAKTRAQSYEYYTLSIAGNQTISQPYIVALMTELADLTPNEKVLEIGTGSGYQSAVLSRLAGEVYSIEIVPELARESEQRLRQLGYSNVTVREGDGYRGWAEHAPFDAILVTAAPDRIPQPLLDQLAPGGRMVIPVGSFFQELKVLSKDKNGKITEKDILPVRFVPMTGEIEKTPPAPE